MKRGMLLMVGATGSGKSTTLAAMINYRNENSSDHIITIEDPIEFLHSNKKSIINQREVGLDTKSYARALRSAMRAAPDVLLIGEIRDRETMESAIMLAGTGHLVLATLHANNAAETLDRIINMFPRDQHTQIFLDLSQYLRAIIAQRLVPGKNKRRAAAVELLINTPHVQELIKKGDVIGAKEALRTSSEKGMQHFDTALYELYRAGRITLEDALTTPTRARTWKRRSTSDSCRSGFSPTSAADLRVPAVRLQPDSVNTAFASNTGPSTHTRFIAGPLGVVTRTAQPAQPPTAHAMNSSSETWHGMSKRRATAAAALSIGVGPHANISTSPSAPRSSEPSHAAARSVT